MDPKSMIKFTEGHVQQVKTLKGTESMMVDMYRGAGTRALYGAIDTLFLRNSHRHAPLTSEAGALLQRIHMLPSRLGDC